ncbi:hypothetical protein Agub_g8012, partial [Astrephomene gubernaculifera]
LVLVVEAAALLRGGVRQVVRQLRHAAGWGGDSGDSGDGGGDGMGSETEAAFDAVAAYVAGRGPLSEVQRHDPRVVLGALEAMDTEVLEQLDVPDVAATRRAVSLLARELRQVQQRGQQQRGGSDGAAAGGGDDDNDGMEGGKCGLAPEAAAGVVASG